jgi:hypothetical protein
VATQKTASQVFAGEYQVVFDAVCRAAQAGGMKVLSADPATGAISLSTSMSMTTWGENLSVQVGQLQPGSIQVTVRSSLKFGLVDWGKNEKNLKAMFFRIEQALAAPAPTAAAPPAGAWHPDPTGRHEHRWWDGAAWSDQVSDAGVVTTDPVEPG